MLNKNKSNVILFNKASNKMPILYILIGIPCSGKSFYAKKCLKNQGVSVVSTDEIRKEYTETMKFNKELNNEIVDIAFLRIKEQLMMKNNVVFDATNTNKKNRKALIELGKVYNGKMIAIVMLTPLHVCLRRNKQRNDENRLPEEVIIKYNKSNLNIDCSEGFDEVIIIKYPY